MTTFPRFVLLVLLASAAVTQAQEMKRYTVESDEFSVMLPKLPAMTTTRGLRYQDRKYQTHRQLETFVDGLLYIVEVYENPEPRQSLDEFISQYQNVFKCDPASERTFTVDGYSGKECSAENKEYLAKVQFFVTETRLYRFLVKRRPDASEAGAQGFFSSIRLGKSTEGIKVTDGPGDPTATAGPPDDKVRLLSKPEPSYTYEARANKIAGTVILKVVFTSKGTVENIRVVRGLPNGLTERAIEAAKKITFVPATKDGHAVSMWMQLEYNFWP